MNLIGNRVVGAVAVLYNDTMNTVQFEDHVVVEARRVWTAFVGVMSKLDDVTEGSEARRLEE